MNHPSAVLHIAVLGGDMRQNYLANYLSRSGHSVICCQTPELPPLPPDVRLTNSLDEALDESTVIIGPVPFSRDQKTINICAQDRELPDRELSDREPSDRKLSDRKLSDRKLSDRKLSDRMPSDRMLPDGTSSGKAPSDNIPTGNTPSDGILLSKLYSLLEKKHFLIGGNLPPSALAACVEKEIPYYDFMKSQSLAYYNAEITAEGMLCEVLKNTPFTLQNRPVLILGYGRCGTILAHKLDALGCEVSICELTEEKRELAASFGFQSFSPFYLQNFLLRYSVIINTVPSLILTGDTFSNLAPDVFLFDLASPPGGIDFQAAKEQNIPVFHCLGLPGKIAPLTAGEAIAKNILERISSNG